MKYEECSIVKLFFEGAVLILIDNIHIWMSSVLIWSLLLLLQWEVRGPWISWHERWRLDAGHRGIFSYGFRSLLQWVIMQCWSVACPSGHIRDCAFSCEQTACREPRRKARLQITGTPLWSFWPRSTNNNNSGSAQWDKDRFNIRHHGSC